MPLQQKLQINGNDLTRMLANTKEGAIEHQEILGIIEKFTKSLKSSRYCVKLAREAVMSGIRGWKTRARKRKRCNQPFYRLAQDTVQERARKQLLEKEMWYKEKKDDQQEEESPSKYQRIEGGRISSFPTRGKGSFSKKAGNVKAVLFVPHTQNSELAKRLRENENTLENVTGNRVKVVERAGVKIQDILTGNNPWKGQDCGRENCFLCSTKLLTGKGLNKDCRKRGIIYEIRCLSCEKAEKEKLQEIYQGNELKEKEKEIRN